MRARSCSTAVPTAIAGPSDAIARGIGMVHQHFMLVPVFSVAENIVLGNETMANPVFLDTKKADGRIRDLARQLGFEIDPDVLVGELSVGIQQRIEILKALYRGAKVLILDEPTAVLTPQETAEIFQVFRRLASEGTSIVFISHKLYEVLEIADTITVIRRGKVVGQADPKTATEEDLAEMMVGREVSLVVEKGPASPGDVVLQVEDLSVADDRGTTVVEGLGFEVRAGEIFGIAGVAGNGQNELVEALTGLRKSTAGRISLAGRRRDQPFAPRPVRARRRLRPGRPASLRAGPVLPDRGQPRPHRLPRRAVLALRGHQRAGDQPSARPSSSPSSTSGPRPARCRPTRCPAATSRSSSWRASSAAR